jgi:ABC-type transport system involved in multi-copper enzyme maturation permease subunit
MILRLQLVRLLRSGRLIVALLAIAAFLGLALIEVTSSADLSPEMLPLFAITLFLHGAYFGLPVVAAAEGAAQISGETSSGTLLLLLTRPLSPRRIFLAKFFTAYAYLLVLIVVLLVACLATGWAAMAYSGGWSESWSGLAASVQSSGVFGSEGPSGIEESLSMRQALLRTLLLVPAVGWAMLVPFSLSFLISSWVKRPLNAAVLALALHWILIFSTRNWLSDATLHLVRGILQEPDPWRGALLDAAKIGAFALVILFLALRRFRLREER